MPKCQYTTEKGFRFFLPGCMGGAVYGMDGCTCGTVKFLLDDAERVFIENKNLRETITRLENIIYKLKRRVNNGQRT